MSSTITILNIIQGYLTITLGCLLVVGVIGNSLNCLVFLRKRLRSNPCSIFFVAASFANIIVLIYYLIPTIYSTYNSPALENIDIFYCKIRLYLRNILLVTSRTYLAFACAAYYAQTSRSIRVRQLFQQKRTLKIVFIVPCIWLIIPIHIPIFTYIQNGKCQMWLSAAALYHSIYICFVAAILPTSLMAIFNLLAYKNLQKMLRNIHPNMTHEELLNSQIERIRLSKNDRQLSKMLFIQIIVYMIFTITYPIQTVYNAIIAIIGKTRSTERIAIENFTLFLTQAFLLNFYSATSFFIFLTSTAFRKSLRKLSISICNQRRRPRNRVLTSG